MVSRLWESICSPWLLVYNNVALKIAVQIKAAKKKKKKKNTGLNLEVKK